MNNNYNILLKKKSNTFLETKIIKNVLNGTNGFRYNSPEVLLLNVQTVAFYMGLEHFGIPPEEWD